MQQFRQAGCLQPAQRVNRQTVNTLVSLYISTCMHLYVSVYMSAISVFVCINQSVHQYVCFQLSWTKLSTDFTGKYINPYATHMDQRHLSYPIAANIHSQFVRLCLLMKKHGEVTHLPPCEPEHKLAVQQTWCSWQCSPDPWARCWPGGARPAWCTDLALPCDPHGLTPPAACHLSQDQPHLCQLTVNTWVNYM